VAGHALVKKEDAGGVAAGAGTTGKEKKGEWLKGSPRTLAAGKTGEVESRKRGPRMWEERSIRLMWKESAKKGRKGGSAHKRGGAPAIPIITSNFYLEIPLRKGEGKKWNHHET